MAILHSIIIFGSEKAKSVMNIDMVKPIPASIETPKNYFIFTPSGKLQKPSAIEMDENKIISKGLLKIKPHTMPILFELLKAEIQSVGITMHVFANANSGKIK